MRFTAQADIPVAEFISTREQVAEVCSYFERVPGPIGFDTETSGLDYDGLFVDVFCVGLANNERRVVVPVWNGGTSLWGDGANNLGPLLPFLANTQRRHAGYNWIYDVNALYGYTRWKLRTHPFQLKSCWADGMKLFCHFDEEGEDTYGVRKLKDRCRYWLGLPMNDFDKVVQGRGFSHALENNYELAVDYAARDAWGHLGLALLGQQVTREMPWCMRCPECGDYCFEQDLNDARRWYCVDHGWQVGGEKLSMWDWHTELDVPFLHVLQKMQVRGVPMDWQYLASTVEPLRMAIAREEAAFHAEVLPRLREHHGDETLTLNLNLRSDQQLAALYHTEVDSTGKPVGFGYPSYTRTDSGAASMKDDALRTLMVRQQAPGILHILEHRRLQKVLSTYVIGLSERRFPLDNRLHGSFRPTTTTGRLRSADPNMQNFPTRRIVVTMPPAAAYVPTIDEMLRDWGCTQEEAEAELCLPEYQSRDLEVNIRRAVCTTGDTVILCADYSQLEIRLSALDSRCSSLIEVLLQGLDMHCYAAGKAFASALHGVTYDDLFEAKQSKDGDTGPQWRTILSLRDPDVAANTFAVRTAKLSDAGRAEMAAQWGAALEVLRNAPDDDVRLYIETCAPDVYAFLAKLLGLRYKEWNNLRAAAKACIFGIIYGIGATKLAAQITEATKTPYSIEEAKQLIHAITEVIFPGIGRMVTRQKTALRKFGYIRTAMGRYRTPAGVFSGNSGKRAKAERQSTNSPIQGLAADVVQRAMLAIDSDPELIRYGAYLLSQVHDELLMEVPKRYAEPALARMKHLMETAHRLHAPVPLSVTGHAATTWDEAK